MECLALPQLGYGDFSKRLHRQAASRRIPVMGSLELTFRCNLRCQHCYVSHGHGGISGQRELSAAEIHRIIDQVVDEGCLWFLITGGEPLWRRDFPDVYAYARRKGLLVTLFTNGTMLTPRLADLLAEQRPFSVEITLYGHSQQTYERVTGVPGSHGRCRRGIELLLERDVPLKLKTMVMTLNQHELADMQAFAQSLGVGFRFDALLNAGLGGCKRPLSLRITPEQVVELDMQDALRREGLVRMYAGLENGQPTGDCLYLCNAGLISYHIDPYGQLCLCMMDRSQAYDLRQGDFKEGWWNFLAQARSLACSPQEVCSQCLMRMACAQCPGWARMEHGDPQRRVAYLCQVTHLRGEVLAQAGELAGYEIENRFEQSYNLRQV